MPQLECGQFGSVCPTQFTALNRHAVPQCPLIFAERKFASAATFEPTSPPTRVSVSQQTGFRCQRHRGPKPGFHPLSEQRFRHGWQVGAVRQTLRRSDRQRPELAQSHRSRGVCAQPTGTVEARARARGPTVQQHVTLQHVGNRSQRRCAHARRGDRIQMPFAAMRR